MIVSLSTSTYVQYDAGSPCFRGRQLTWLGLACLISAKTPSRANFNLIFTRDVTSIVFSLQIYIIYIDYYRRA